MLYCIDAIPLYSTHAIISLETIVYKEKSDASKSSEHPLFFPDIFRIIVTCRLETTSLL